MPEAAEDRHGRVADAAPSERLKLLDDGSGASAEALGDPSTPGTHFLQRGDEEFIDATPWWEYWPRRWNVVAFALSADLVCYMDRASISVAMIPMAAQYGWSKEFQGARAARSSWRASARSPPRASGPQACVLPCFSSAC